MTQDQITEGNKLIAYFMGNKQKTLKYEAYSFLRYHVEWNQLMPVVEKIESCGCIVEMWLCLGRGCRIIKGSFKEPVKTIANTESNLFFESVWLAVVDFIKWHNSEQGAEECDANTLNQGTKS